MFLRVIAPALVQTKVYCVMLTKTSAAPTPIQVSRGFNSKNQIKPSNSTIIAAAATMTFEVAELESSTAYYAYILAGSDQPGFSDLQTQANMYVISFTTPEKPIGKRSGRKRYINSTILLTDTVFSVAVLVTSAEILRVITLSSITLLLIIFT